MASSLATPDAASRTAWARPCAWRRRRPGRTQTALGAFYRRIKGRIGGRGAITATAHKLSRLVYRMLKHGVEYASQSLERYEAQMREKQERSLRRRAESLGFDLVARPPSPS